MKSKNNNPITYAFIDSQNLNLGTQSQGWRVDFRRLRLYLKNKHNVTRAFLFIGFIPQNTGLYLNLTRAGFELIYKPTVAYLEQGKEMHKGNVDAELVLWAAARVFPEYEKAIVISGDGDFCCLYEYLEEHNKLKLIIAPSHRFSHLLSPFKSKVIRISKYKNILEYKKTTKKRNRPIRSVETLGRAGINITHQRSVETLGLSRHGDSKKSITKRPHNVNRHQKGATK